MIYYQISNSRSGVNNDINIFRNFEFMPHMHRDFEFIYILSGMAILTVEGVNHEMSEGETALVLSNQIHGFTTPESSEMLIHVFSPDNVRSFVKLLGNRVGKNPVFSCDNEVKRFYFECCIRKSRRTPLFIKGCLYAVCDEFLTNSELVEYELSGGDVLHTMLIYISEHFKEDITLRSMSACLGYEPHYLSRVFGKTVGINLKKYINLYRVDYAKYCLLYTGEKVTEIALRSGFQSIRNFNRVFYESEGVTPNRFRNPAQSLK